MSPDLFVACERAVHVVAADGRIFRAGRACLFILDHIGFSWLARLLMIPPFVWVVEMAYSVVARHRPFFARFLFTREHPRIPDDR